MYSSTKVYNFDTEPYWPEIKRQPFVVKTPVRNTSLPTIQQITYGNDGYQVESLKERMATLEIAMKAWVDRYEKKLKEHEETVDMLLGALKNATK